MKFLHLSDLHIGKKLCGYSLLEGQKNVLSQTINLIKKEKIENILIAGDVFDRSIPSINALEIFDNFLMELNKLKTNVFIIAGNHDSEERLAHLSKFLHNSNIYISQGYKGEIEKIELKDSDIYFFPYIIPAIVRRYHPDEKIENYNDAVKIITKNIKLNKNKINIALCHQFVAGIDEPIISQSEQKSVGGIDIVSYKNFEKFDYVALGHLHCPQKAGAENIRYGGSLLKYSFSEINQNKVFTIVEFDKNKKINIKFEKIIHSSDLAKYKGYINEFLSEEFYSKINRNDYIHFVLLDENVVDAKNKLSLIYPNIAILEFDNSFTKQLQEKINPNLQQEKTMLEHFRDFYRESMQDGLSAKKEEIVKKTIEEMKNATS